MQRLGNISQSYKMGLGRHLNHFFKSKIASFSQAIFTQQYAPVNRASPENTVQWCVKMVSYYTRIYAPASSFRKRFKGQGWLIKLWYLPKRFSAK